MNEDQGRGMSPVELSRAVWKKSSHSSANGDCVEVAALDDEAHGRAIAVRDSKNPTGPALLFATGQWNAFLGGVRHGEFDGA